MVGIREYFSSALRYLLGPEGKRRGFYIPQNVIAEKTGIHVSTLGDYTHGRRESTEDKRRDIARVLGFEYIELISLGRLIYEEYEPREWEYSLLVLEKYPGYTFWKNKKDNAQTLIIPPPGISEEQARIELSNTMFRSKPSGGIPLFDMRTDFVQTANLAVDRNLLSQQLVSAYVQKDNSMSPTFKAGDMALTSHETEIISGEVYVLLNHRLGETQIRRIFKSAASMYNLVADNPDFPTIENIKLKSIEIRGRVITSINRVATTLV